MFPLLFSFVRSQNYAILFAGSNGWNNYRHQADIFTMYYKLVHEREFDPENIMMFAYNDIVNASENFYRGHVYHSSMNIDVYPGDDRINYTGNKVTSEYLFNYMLNMKSTTEDNIFFYYNDHGGPYVISTPLDVIYSWEFNDILSRMKQKGLFKKMFISIEACYTGSFTDMLTVDDVILFTAARNNESSYEATLNDEKTFYHSNEYSERFFNFMDDAKLTIAELYDLIDKQMLKSKPTKKFTAEEGKMRLSTFIGEQKRKDIRRKIAERIALADITKHTKEIDEKRIAESRRLRDISKRMNNVIDYVIVQVAGAENVKNIKMNANPKFTESFKDVLQHFMNGFGEINQNECRALLYIKSLCTEYDSKTINAAIDNAIFEIV